MLRWKNRRATYQGMPTINNGPNERDHIDQLAVMIPDELEEDPKEDPMKYHDDDGELTEGSVIDGEDMGEADVSLGIKSIRSTDGIAISRSHYVEKIIGKFGYQNSRIAKTPYDFSITLFKNESSVSVAQLRELRYPKGTVSLAVHYGRFPAVLEGYSYAS
ncbi:UNVERIFIED_CONTAM: hypothetical protein Scaly_1930300 [Sesamum calycinum]|uniref:Uncharacterized protein n=1 Tax=Sesamum calycinum TaxID=2727403 RepID=A0AAW2NF84_9LAMI